MSQWGARGMAAAGASYETILRHYYTGTTLGRVAAPRRIEVGVAWGRRSAEVFGAFRLIDATGRVVVPRAYGTWRFTEGSGGTLEVGAPPGFGRVPAIALLDPPRRVVAGQPVRLVVRLAAPARVTATASGPGVARAAVAVGDRGVRRVEWRAPRKPGIYRVRLTASSGPGREATARGRIAVVAADDVPEESPATDGWSAIATLAGALLLVTVAVGAGAFAGTMRR